MVDVRCGTGVLDLGCFDYGFGDEEGDGGDGGTG